MNKDLAKGLGEYLNKVRDERGAMVGVTYNWRDIALLIGIHENTLARWAKGLGLPSTIEQFYALETWFGPGVYQFYADGMDPNLVYLLAHRHDPNVAAVIRQARQAAEDNKEAEKDGKQSQGKERGKGQKLALFNGV